MMKLAEQPPILEHFAALSDGTRIRILLVLEQRELTVAELCGVLQLPQSTVSRHLKVLADNGWVLSRPDGTRRLYRLLPEELESPARGLWRLAREQVASGPAAAHDARRLEGVLAMRRSRSREFFASAAGQWDRTRDELFGARIHSGSLLGLLQEDWVVGDLGCGTGAVADALAPFVGQLIGVDDSTAMLEAAGRRLETHPNVDLRRGDLESLPIEDRQLDAATLILVLHHVPDPEIVLREVGRVLKPDGSLLLVDMLPHERSEYQQQMGHVWLGFSEDQVVRLLAAAGLRPGGFRSLPIDPAAKGPSLFAARATRPSRRAASSSMTTYPRNKKLH